MEPQGIPQKFYELYFKAIQEENEKYVELLERVRCLFPRASTGADVRPSPSNMFAKPPAPARTPQVGRERPRAG